MTREYMSLEELFSEAGLKVTTIDLTTPEQREQEERAKAMDIAASAKPLIEELCRMVDEDSKRGTEYESAYLGKATRFRTREIGQVLYEIEGHELMMRAYYEVRNRHGAGSSRSLEMAWDGIGEWRD